MDWRWGSSGKESDYKHEALRSNSSLTKKKVKLESGAECGGKLAFM
jgi:hypothetical protein